MVSKEDRKNGCSKSVQNSEDVWDEGVFTAVMLVEDECVLEFLMWENVVEDEKNEISRSGRKREERVRN